MRKKKIIIKIGKYYFKITATALLYQKNRKIEIQTMKSNNITLGDKKGP
jgi:hypothetical protein